MKNRLKTMTILIVILWASLNSNGQSYQISRLTPIDPPQNHYETLQKLSGQINGVRAWMDTIRYPAAIYNDYTIVSALMKPTYLHSDQIDFLVNEMEYPANSSKQTKAELEFLLDLQSKRTKQQTERVMQIAKIGYWPEAYYVPTHPKYQSNLENLFFEINEVMEENHDPNEYPATVNLLKSATDDMRLMEFRVKYNLLRARPYQLEPKLEPLREIKSPSFASGHTLWAYVQAYILAELVPEKREAFLGLAYEIGYSRELMGVHYPSDEEAARQLAHRMVALMWNTMAFQNDFRTAKNEWK